MRRFPRPADRPITRLVTCLVTAAALGCSGTAALSASAAPPGPRAAARLKQDLLRHARTPGAPAAEGVGNGVFQVYATPAGRPGAGQFTVTTGTANPAGPGRDVLFGQGAPGTSYMIVRDVDDNGTDYVQGQMLTHANERSLDDYPSYQSVSGNTITTSWSPPSLTIDQTVSVTGTTAADTRVTVTTKIYDFHTAKHRFRIQYLWDTAIGADDGPAVQPRPAGTPYRPFDPVIGVEHTAATGGEDTVVVDDDANTGPPTLAVAVSGTGRPQAVPETVKYVCWPDAVYAPLGEYVTDDTRDISGSGSGCRNANGAADSALALVWSANAAQGSPEVAASLRMSPPTPHPTTMKAGPLSLGSATAALTDTATGKPLAGRAVRFTSGASSCAKVTDASGHATCGGLLGGLLGYDVAYAGGAVWGPSSDHGGLLLAGRAPRR
ncbi:hypothetical protein [Actinomadura roseirufa]|uniref:hypothetical protein n=1 Tax=Actinomadura roseirufa TaxID=2094049 RepID=UPI00104176D6|nr:hypothetical protein [Actinomadura roseirufa]